MFNGDVQHMLALIRADVAAIAVGLLLEIILGFPYNIMLDHG